MAIAPDRTLGAETQTGLQTVVLISSCKSSLSFQFVSFHESIGGGSTVPIFASGLPVTVLVLELTNLECSKAQDPKR